MVCREEVSVLHPRPGSPDLDRADLGSVYAEVGSDGTLPFPGSQALADLPDDARTEFGGCPVPIKTPVEHVLFVSSEVEMPDVEASVFTAPTGVEDEQVSGIAVGEDPQCAGSGEVLPVDLGVGQGGFVSEGGDALISAGVSTELPEEFDTLPWAEFPGFGVSEVLPSLSAMGVHGAETMSMMGSVAPFDTAALGSVPAERLVSLDVSGSLPTPVMSATPAPVLGGATASINTALVVHGGHVTM